MKPGLLMLPSAVSNSRVHNILPNKIETDFQFSRASAATRVNHQGLIEEVGYFSDELVRNGNFSELGPELIINGDFATDSNWNKLCSENVHAAPLGRRGISCPGSGRAVRLHARVRSPEAAGACLETFQDLDETRAASQVSPPS